MSDLLWFKETLKNNALLEQIKKIKLVISDIDGCLTDCKIYPLEDMEEIKGYSIQDGFATVQAQKAGLVIALLTGKNGELLKKRATALNIPEHRQFLGFGNEKSTAIGNLQKQEGVNTDEILFFGDDFLDVELKNLVGIFTCPKNAVFYIKTQAKLIIPKSGGYGAFRLLLDLILYVQNKHFAQEYIDEALST